VLKRLSAVDIAAHTQSMLGEGPAWNQKYGVLHFVDIFGKKVHTLDPKNGELKSFKTELSPGAVIPTTQDKLALALNDGVYLVDFSGNNLENKYLIEQDIATNRMNDAKCDPTGKLFAGTMGDGNSPSGSLYKIDNKGFEKIQDQITVSNGLGWNPDGSKMYYIDSGKNCVQISNFDLTSSTVNGFKVFVEFPSSHGIPDGMCTDLEGGIWVAFFGGSQIRRYSDTGIQTHFIELPVPQITSCCFAGEGSTMLYITTASIDVGDGRTKDLNEGNLFCIDVGIPGAGTTPFII
jgi:sugar lactone lactonase YvrE